MARNLLHFSLHLLSNKTSIIIKQRRLDGKQRDSIVLFQLFREDFGNCRKTKSNQFIADINSPVDRSELVGGMTPSSGKALQSVAKRW